MHEQASRTSVDPWRAFARRLTRVLGLAGLGVLALGAVLLLPAGLLPPGSVRRLLEGMGGQFWGDGEGNVWAWYNTVLLALLATAFAAHALLLRATRRPAGALWVLAAAATYLSVDESAQLHEKLDAFGDAIGERLTYPWLVLGVPIALLAAIVLLRVTRALDVTTRRLLIRAGLVYVLGAVGFEFIGGVLVEELQFPVFSAPYIAEVLVEESLEMTGVLIALYAALAAIAPVLPELLMRADSSDAPAAARVSGRELGVTTFLRQFAGRS